MKWLGHGRQPSRKLQAWFLIAQKINGIVRPLYWNLRSVHLPKSSWHVMQSCWSVVHHCRRPSDLYVLSWISSAWSWYNVHHNLLVRFSNDSSIWLTLTIKNIFEGTTKSTIVLFVGKRLKIGCRTIEHLKSLMGLPTSLFVCHLPKIENGAFLRYVFPNCGGKVQ
jgi:hypothetical protein